MRGEPKTIDTADLKPFN